MTLTTRTELLARQLDTITFSKPVAYVYNPLVYAYDGARRYLELFGASSPREILIVGMNPGPWGMVQSGVPFGDIASVKNWMNIDCSVGKPQKLHPKRPVDGYDCKRSEVSGKRLWGWAKNTFGSPEKFFNRFLVLNYCPLAFFSADGVNITPDKIALADRKILYEICDSALYDFTTILKPSFVIGVGAFAAKRVREALSTTRVTCGQITHPSPANPKANKGWEFIIHRELEVMGVEIDRLIG